MSDEEQQRPANAALVEYFIDQKDPDHGLMEITLGDTRIRVSWDLTCDICVAAALDNIAELFEKGQDKYAMARAAHWGTIGDEAEKFLDEQDS